MTAATTETPAEALARIQSGQSRNDAVVILAFASRGLPLHDIDPRQNVLTYRAWLAKGRHVKRGEKAVRITTWIPIGEKRDTHGKVVKPAGTRPKAAHVFHVSQTEPNR